MGLSAASKLLLKRSGGVAKGIVNFIKKPVTMYLDRLESANRSVDAYRKESNKKIIDSKGFSKGVKW